MSYKGVSVQQGIGRSPEGGSRNVTLLNPPRNCERTASKKSSTMKRSPGILSKISGKFQLKCKIGDIKINNAKKRLGLDATSKEQMSTERRTDKASSTKLEKRSSSERVCESKWKESQLASKKQSIRKANVECLIDRLGLLSQETDMKGNSPLLSILTTQRKHWYSFYSNNSEKEGNTEHLIVYPLQFNNGGRKSEKKVTMNEIDGKLVNTFKMLEAIKKNVLEIQLDLREAAKEAPQGTDRSSNIAEELAKLKNRIIKFAQSRQATDSH
eukprot:TRINITY_DN4597_c0_g2_i4.p1 TRINITY_DN4597_c0_g2~~TRINITY_DN4597_c0_g2_i4.p1  ORF type:complete len:270 (+),score=38.02 TRINITY_DN4597_c0_g2_i4:310-1119(+)